eukprot:m.110316 g.110316  ORF g.110316 m.110316 type:complete len:347 (-) comp28028_c0_seq1:78-1118(-)
MSVVVEPDSIESELLELTKIRGDLEPSLKAFLEAVEKMHAMQSKCTGLRDGLKKKIRLAELLLKDSKEKEPEAYTEQLKLANKVLNSTNKKLPVKASWLINLIVGDLNVWDPRFTFRLDYKKKYETYKLTFTIGIIVFAALILGLIYQKVENRVLESMFHFMMILFYSTTTIREHILVVNGSQIRTWWIAHQYLSIAQSIVHFSWPKSESYELFRFQFFVFSLYIGVVQLIQHWYQTKTLYTKIALGHGKEQMAHSRGLPDKSTFAIVVVALAIAYVFQFANGVILTMMYARGHVEWQVPLLALNFLILGTGNTMTTMSVVYAKLMLFKQKHLPNFDSPFLTRKKE